MKIINLTLLIACISLINTFETSTETFIHHGQEREFSIHFPKIYKKTSEDFPVIIMIHGYAQTSEDMLKNTKFHKYATKKGYIVVGAEEVQDSKSPTWNYGSNINQLKDRDIDDSNYFRRMIQILAENYRVNPDMIFVVGWQTGASMVYRLACELSDKIAGVVPSHGPFGLKDTINCLDASKPLTPWEFGPFSIGGWAYNQETCPYEIWKNKLPSFFQCNQTKEVPMMIINGIQDPIMHEEGVWFDGVKGFEKDGIPFEWYSAPNEFGPKYFIEKYNCNPLKMTETYNKINKNDIEDYSECFSTQPTGNDDCKTEVVQCVSNGGHQWFGMDAKTNEAMEKQFQSHYGPQPQTFDSNKEVVKFFDRIRKKVALKKDYYSDL